MAELGRLPKTLLDYATTTAKRQWSRTVQHVHLFAAIRKWDESWFDEQFPDAQSQLADFFGASLGECMRPERVDASVLQSLEKIENVDDVKKVAIEIYEVIKSELSSGPKPADNENTPQATVARQTEKSGAQEVVETEVGKVEVTPATLQLNKTLASRVAVALAAEYAVVQRRLANDAAIIGRRVLGIDNAELAVVVLASLGVAGETNTADVSYDLISSLLALGTVDGDRVATQVALAYVDAAEFAASLDKVVTEAEIDTIDSIRLETREILGERIDASSDAMMEFEAQFGQLVGMESVKKDLRKRVEFMLVNKKKVSRGESGSVHRMHMAFVGNPGTGKTTVARLFGQLLNKVDLLKSTAFVETDRSTLVADHVGGTEKRTREALRKAKGGVLFVDEAYALNDGYFNQKGFGEEAVDVLVKAMEDMRDSLAVVFAGYTDRMDEFLDINPGLKSRIPAVIEFPDYTTDELIEIAQRLVKVRKLKFDSEAIGALRLAFERLKSEKGFGNAREVENLIDAAQRNLTTRIAPKGNLATSKESCLLLEADIPAGYTTKQKQPFGFNR
jgi:stage V sporulation protein K